MSINFDLYRVQTGKPWYRRKWQTEWDYCYFAQRGYTKVGVKSLAWLRVKYPFWNKIYVRIRIIIRRNFTQKDWYQQRYDFWGKSLHG